MTTAETAIAFAKRGWKVLPVAPQSKVPYFEFAKHGFKSATDNAEAVAKWFERNPALNFGVACAMSGLVVFDVDYRNGGDTHGLNLDTFTVRTGDGLHLYYRTEPCAVFGGKLRQGVDIKFNGYVVAPTSIHPSGLMYEIAKDLPPSSQVFA